MNKEIKQKWIDALLSGEYQQGKDVLHNLDDNSYCCLGVLCDLAVKEGVAKNFTEYHCEYYGNDEFKSDLDLPKCIMEWAEIEESCGEYKKGNLSLAILNDRGRSFKYISKVIEKNF